MKKWLNKYGVIIVPICVIIFTIWGMWYASDSRLPDPIPGQVYIYEDVQYDPRNPFDVPDHDTILVLEVNDGYMLWCPRFQDTSFTLSGKVGWRKRYLKPYKHIGL